MSRNRKQRAVPHSIKALLLDGFIGKTLGAGGVAVAEPNQSDELRETPFEEHRTSDDHQIIQPNAGGKAHVIRNEWIQLAIVIDRIAFFVYVLFFIFMGVLHFV